MAILWASKINLNGNVHEIYHQPESLRRIQELLRSKIENGLEYVKRFEITIEDNTYVNESKFQFATIENLETNYNYSICGHVVKTHTIFANEVNLETGATKSIPIENDEKILFYYDVYKEIVVFDISKRFGYREFNEIFAKLLDKAMEGTDYTFDVSLINDGLNLSDIKNELKNLGKIEELSIKIIPPNPNDDLLRRIFENGTEALQLYEEANLTRKETKFYSSVNDGLNIDSQIVEDSLNEVVGVNSQLTTDDALKNGYLKVEATSKTGKKMTSEEMKPVKRIIKEDDKTISKFIDIGKNFVTSIIVGSGSESNE